MKPSYHRTSIATKTKLDLIGKIWVFHTGTLSIDSFFIGVRDNTVGDLSKPPMGGNVYLGFHSQSFLLRDSTPTTMRQALQMQSFQFCCKQAVLTNSNHVLCYRYFIEKRQNKRVHVGLEACTQPNTFTQVFPFTSCLLFFLFNKLTHGRQIQMQGQTRQCREHCGGYSG